VSVPWRGTLLYTGTLAAVAVTVAARFSGADLVAEPGAAPPPPAPSTAPVPATSITPPADQAAGALENRRSTGSPSAPSSTPTSAPSTAPAKPAPAKPAPAAPAPAAAAPAKPAPAAPAPAPATSTTITGSVVQTPYGPVQVAVTFTGSTVSAVQTLRHPGGNGTSTQINAYALPILTQEAVAANSAQVQAVSGASYTSHGYQQSLQSAIDHRP
jgi:uncharacterized protein with FMN-binding domain